MMLMDIKGWRGIKKTGSVKLGLNSSASAGLMRISRSQGLGVATINSVEDTTAHPPRSTPASPTRHHSWLCSFAGLLFQALLSPDTLTPQPAPGSDWGAGSVPSLRGNQRKRCSLQHLDIPPLMLVWGSADHYRCHKEDQPRMTECRWAMSLHPWEHPDAAESIITGNWHSQDIFYDTCTYTWVQIYI